MRNFNALHNRRTAPLMTIVSVGAAGLLLVGCGTEYDVSGTVLKGADGKEYVVPNDASRPVYKNQAACEADVKAQEANLGKLIGGNIDPASLCVPVGKYRAVTVYPRTYYYGPMVSGKQEWKSGDTVGWSSVRDGSFAASGEALQQDVAPAPDGAKEGEHQTVQEHEGGIFDGGHGDGDGHSVVGHGGGEDVEVHPVIDVR
jgi:hypothetical protein